MAFSEVLENKPLGTECLTCLSQTAKVLPASWLSSPLLPFSLARWNKEVCLLVSAYLNSCTDGLHSGLLLLPHHHFPVLF